MHEELENFERNQV
jgi:hypothetical protein